MAAISRRAYDFPLPAALTRKAGVTKAPPAEAKQRHAAIAAAAHANNSLVPYSRDSKPRTVQALVDMCCGFMNSVWGPRTYVLPLKTFIHEVLRRSRVQYPVFQMALCYIMQLKPVIEKRRGNGDMPAPLTCGRRMFVAALQVASKYLQDRSYSVKSWSRISGLDVADLKANELALLSALNWQMHIPYEAYMRCCRRLRIAISNAYMSFDLSGDELTRNLYEEGQETMRTVYATPTASPDAPALVHVVSPTFKDEVRPPVWASP